MLVVIQTFFPTWQVERFGDVRGLWTNSTISNLAGGIEAPGKTFFFSWVPFEAVRFEETFGWVVLQEPSTGYIPNKFRLWLIYAWFMAYGSLSTDELFYSNIHFVTPNQD